MSMKSLRYILSLAFVSVMSTVSVFAQQNLRTAYFLDGYTYNYKLNPAFAPERGFFAIPALGNLGIGMETNFALSTFLYPTYDGNLTTFLNNSVDDAFFLNKLNTLNLVSASINESIVSTGFRIRESFHTIDLSVKADAGAVVPKDLFEFLKSGSSTGKTAWDISRTGMRANARMEFAYGYSRSINDWARIGARIKVLMGMARADLLIDELNLKTGHDEWAVSAHGNAEISGPVSIGTKTGTTELDLADVAFPEDLDEIIEYISDPSIGFAMDLGASFDFLEYFTASVSVLDLGYINWKSTTTAEMPGGSWSHKGFEGVDADNIEDELSSLETVFTEMIKLEKTECNLAKSKSLAATVHAGIEARMPFYERLTFGILGTQRIDGIYSWTEGRVSANLAPTRWFSLSASGALSNYGKSAGGAVNIHLPGINLYAGVDSYLPLLNVTPQYIPIDSFNTNVTLGLAITFGKANGRYWN